MISCEHHDYIEIACMYRLHVKLLNKDGEETTGVALDTQRNDDQEECIRINADGVEELVVLDSLVSMQALDENPHFDRVSFDEKD